MTYFPDLSAYDYRQVSDSVEDKRLLNVGWLDSHHAFKIEVPHEEFVAALLALITHTEHRFNLTRGFQSCPFCPPTSFDGPVRYPTANDRGSTSVGMDELHVDGSDGTRYAAPSLIVHYVLTHHYRPPPGFVDAVVDAVS